MAVITADVAPASTTSTMPAAPVVSAAAADSGAKVREVSVEISVEPNFAELSVDGEPVANPFRTRRPHHETHSLKIEARAPGYRPHSVSKPLSDDVHLSFTLQSEPSTRPRPKPRQSGARTKSTPE
jgi:hypothetical protein